ncbi:hypothetical protein HYP99_gp036 [Sinorhizobium phage ort11]|uniref:Uncharacterized protein n=1 Tax=Sinorhizobium phage ort11 TaxID=2599764 RepID=A0A5C2H1D1_9CAUD|nr:hypothetical protein HYP99_gp036 [Sinorhizobium phage ort11]QEP29834.1 hypothetical protein Smphiort11_036 [Sinorhizobium phage ort11]
MKITYLKLEVHTELIPSDSDLKDIIYALQTKVKESEFIDGPKGNIIQRVFVKEMHQ